MTCKTKGPIACLLLIFLAGIAVLPAQMTAVINPELRRSPWEAKWIHHPDTDRESYGVYYFRNSLELKDIPSEFVVHVSADNRYKFYVNGTYLGNGPAAGDVLKWRFESYNIAPYLKPGKNVLAAVVWNFAEFRPVFQSSYGTGFLLQGNGDGERMVNTGEAWKVYRDTAYSPLPFETGHYYVVGPGEHFRGAAHPWNWQGADYDDSDWTVAASGETGITMPALAHYGHPHPRVLFPRNYPAMEEKPQRFAAIVRTGMDGLPQQFLKGGHPFTVPPDSEVSILLDQGYLTNAYPQISYSGGEDGRIRLTYAEALFDKTGAKGNRNDIAGKEIVGPSDVILADGGRMRNFQTLWWRTFRYVELHLSTGEAPLTIHDIQSTFTGYPLPEKADFASSHPGTKAIWDTGWRTQRLCAGETFFDCPYYEQLQYVGDTRIQSLLTTYVSGDTLLFRNAIEAIFDSRLPFGLTQSRYPSREVQVIPTFSLIWITMISDYQMLCEDPALIRNTMPAILHVLKWFENRIDDTGLLGPVEWWNFVDWVSSEHWVSGAPLGTREGGSSILSLQYVYTLQKVVPILEEFGFSEAAGHYAALGEKIRLRVYETTFDEEKGLLADVAGRDIFSQHANIFGILTGAIPEATWQEVMKRVLDDKGLAQSSYYFTFYLIEALDKAGMGGDYMDTLGPWEDMLDLGLTTFAEKQEPTRSDCHAWSASPLYYFLSLVCGIKPAEPGFRSVIIRPQPGALTYVKGNMPHRLGMISVDLRRTGGGLRGSIELPPGLNGRYEFKGKALELVSGVNTIDSD